MCGYVKTVLYVNPALKTHVVSDSVLCPLCPFSGRSSQTSCFNFPVPFCHLLRASPPPLFISVSSFSLLSLPVIILFSNFYIHMACFKKTEYLILRKVTRYNMVFSIRVNKCTEKKFSNSCNILKSFL